MFDQYEAKYQEYQSLKSLNDDLRGAVNAAQSKCSKEVVLGLINQKIQQIDGAARAQEKDLLKENIDIKTFMKTYIDQRTQYHKYQLMKVKVSQS